MKLLYFIGGVSFACFVVAAYLARTLIREDWWG